MPTDPASLALGSVPAEARDAWLELNGVLDRVGTVPCQCGDPEAWWPPARKPFHAALRAVAACHGCAAQDACLAYALAADERFGIWGGTLPDERRALRRRRRRPEGRPAAEPAHVGAGGGRIVSGAG